jgi:Uma2 family endonuclease
VNLAFGVYPGGLYFLLSLPTFGSAKMSTTLPPIQISVHYAEYAREYMRNLPLEHFMEPTSQARQREITLESFAVLRVVRSDVHVYNELLVQYPLRGRKRPGQIVPDNMIVFYDGPLDVDISYDVPVQPAQPFWVMEYVTRNCKRKDYGASPRKYERELKVPYYLLFHPDDQKLTLYHLKWGKHVAVKANAHGRYPARKLNLEVGLLSGWVRYWYKGELLLLPEELLRERDQEKQRAEREKQRADHAKQCADQAKERADQAKLCAEMAARELERLRAQLRRVQARSEVP